MRRIPVQVECLEPRFLLATDSSLIGLGGTAHTAWTVPTITTYLVNNDLATTTSRTVTASFSVRQIVLNVSDVPPAAQLLGGASEPTISESTLPHDSLADAQAIPQASDLVVRGGLDPNGPPDLYRISLNPGTFNLDLTVSWEGANRPESGRLYLQDDQGHILVDQPISKQSETTSVALQGVSAPTDSALYLGLVAPQWDSPASEAIGNTSPSLYSMRITRPASLEAFAGSTSSCGYVDGASSPFLGVSTVPSVPLWHIPAAPPPIPSGGPPPHEPAPGSIPSKPVDHVPPPAPGPVHGETPGGATVEHPNIPPLPTVQSQPVAGILAGTSPGGVVVAATVDLSVVDGAPRTEAVRASDPADVASTDPAPSGRPVTAQGSEPAPIPLGFDPTIGVVPIAGLAWASLLPRPLASPAPVNLPKIDPGATLAVLPRDAARWIEGHGDLALGQGVASRTDAEPAVESASRSRDEGRPATRRTGLVLALNGMAALAMGLLGPDLVATLRVVGAPRPKIRFGKRDGEGSGRTPS